MKLLLNDYAFKIFQLIIRVKRERRRNWHIPCPSIKISEARPPEECCPGIITFRKSCLSSQEECRGHWQFTVRTPMFSQAQQG